jgi:uncharacterized small protein (DUF1192 family)
MDWDEERPRPAKATSIGDNLETLSVAELAARIRDLEAEIVRTRTELDRKRAHEAAAAAVFKR